MSFEDIHEAKIWMIEYQLGRRNLSDSIRTYLMGTRYSEEKLRQGPQGPQSAHSGHFKTCDKIADELGVGESTVRRIIKHI